MRISLLVSICLNLALGAALFYFASPREPAPVPAMETALPAPQTLSANPIVKTNVVVRRQNFTWQQIESTNFVTYIANLRAIGCPEPTVRDIIIAEVNALYDRKRMTEIVTPEQQWWRSTPDQQVVRGAMDQLHALEAEKRALLTQLLGTRWEAANSWEVAAFNMRFDGPVLGNLTPESKHALRETENRFALKRQEYLEAQQKAGQAASPADLARLQQQSREELAKILNPAQLEEYLLRHSEVAQSLRSELRGFEVTSEEFRKIFRARDSVEQQIQLFGSGNDPASLKRREELEKQRQGAVEQALDSERQQLYKFSQDPLFRQAQASAQQIGAPPEAVLSMYQINQAVEQERQRISDDSSLTLEQRATALATMLSQQQESLRKILGDKTYELYRQTYFGAAPGEAK